MFNSALRFVDNAMKVKYSLLILSLSFSPVEFIVGNLTIAQIEDNSTFIEQGSSSATNSLTLISFFLHDPSNYFKSASFIYNWDFGDGYVQLFIYLCKGSRCF